jgi:hypothetical protein
MSSDLRVCQCCLTAQLVHSIILILFFSGFNYQFEALTKDPKENELNRALSIIFRPRTSMPLIQILRGMVPLLRFLVSQNQMLPTVQSIAHIALSLARREGC